jgi:glycosyltransferase involved in cell wall biosynthesis
MPRLITVLPIYCTGEAVTYTCLSLAEAMQPFGQTTEVWVPAAEGRGRRPFVREAVPALVRSLAWRLLGERFVFEQLDRSVLRAVRKDDVLWLWPGTTRTLRDELAARGHRVIAERINCCQGTAKRILDAEYERSGLPQDEHITEGEVAEERAELAGVDRVFAPSPWVRSSLLEAGISEHKIWDTSYGFDPGRLAGESRALEPFEGLTIAFVGYACLRKGVHHLFEAFERLEVPARLVLAGRTASNVAERYADFLKRPDVIRLGHVSDVGAVYRSADVFCFPSLEEGGPMVTYEAMGLGVPVVVTPMGAGAVARDRLDGFVVPPGDVDGLAAALTQLASDAELRRSLGENARARALEFTWQKVAARRQALVDAEFGTSP